MTAPKTVLGHHTAGEVKDLYDVYVYEVTALDAAQSKSFTTAQTIVGGSWPYRWQQFLTGWAAEIQDTGLKAALENAATGFAYWPSEDQFSAMRTAYNGGVSPPDMGGSIGADGYPQLLREYYAMGSTVQPIDWGKGVPQPKAKDWDLNAYQVADDAAKAINRVVAGGTSLLTWGLIGLGVAGVWWLTREKKT